MGASKRAIVPTILSMIVDSITLDVRNSFTDPNMGAYESGAKPVPNKTQVLQGQCKWNTRDSREETRARLRCWLSDLTAGPQELNARMKGKTSYVCPHLPLEKVSPRSFGRSIASERLRQCMAPLVHSRCLLSHAQVAAIVKLQAWFRANVAQNDYRKLGET